MDNFTDLGVTRCTAIKHYSHYHEHYQRIASKAARVSDAVRRIFRSRTRELLWPAFQVYILPVLMYCSPAWNPPLRKDRNVLEAVQRRYTKCIGGLRDKPYNERSSELRAFTFKKQ